VSRDFDPSAEEKYTYTMTSKTHEDLLTRGVSEVIVQKDLDKLLASGKPLRIKHGVDPTRPDLHLGHAVIYRKLRKFQELGHKVIFLIGDYTARFGDPTDKVKSRSLHTKQDVGAAAKSYVEQIGKILDKTKLEIRYNSEWYEKMSAEELLRIMSHFTVSRMLERDMFVARKKAGEEIGLHEPVYPVLQAYDSVMLQSDCTVIGTDQTFNELQARPLQEFFGQKPQQVVTIKILPGTDGKEKMSKTLGNDIKLTLTPEDMFGKLMSIPDSAMEIYAELLTDLPLAEFKKPKDPKAAKVKLATTIVAEFHSAKHAARAGEQFSRVFQFKEQPDNIEEQTVNFHGSTGTATVTVAELFKLSNSEARRLIEQGAIKHDGRVIEDPNEEAKPGVYQKGKRHFKRAKLK
jgi:tyrosyl-tRNA synthetase